MYLVLLKEGGCLVGGGTVGNWGNSWLRVESDVGVVGGWGGNSFGTLRWLWLIACLILWLRIGYLLNKSCKAGGKLNWFSFCELWSAWSRISLISDCVIWNVLNK